jgi:truncated hemoglobin YjbI
MSLYDDIGGDFIKTAIHEFYARAVVDPIIGHFFFEKDIDTLIRKQIDFTSRLLGHKDSQTPLSRPLKSVHHPLGIHSAHFARRQKLLAQVLDDLGLDPVLRDKWLGGEQQLKPLIVRGSAKITC